ncbi:branched-chain amino acid ABC transporter permease protein [Streptomyces lincolnensis]|uniref:Branched-chain amino acid ABC transporter permease protein n=1 Tax=Streptomyces lincolnensis TaxID=1915 RepID=A0A1B1M7C8_STRLN|nr:branched-chain amino acid ABC transporter permease [Streptomyces lincolnensis]ANS64549.1 branched-chain amino acid ABC transporter permease protein [Streptomyces lincolnensis]AXG57244.1 branched-chain amino acid ABC transporter permease protein [Streptomyces lincolnensis]QMV06372.1 branched-chain amino acid ABC transporter permease [Streptomyces lincolnensis]
MTETKNTTPSAGNAPAPGARGLLPLPVAAARALLLAGGIATAASTFLAWTWTSAFPGDLTVTGYPGGLQWLTFTAGIITTLFALASYGIRGLGWLIPARNNAPLFLSALGGFGVTWYTVLAISVDLGGLANLEPGGFIAAIASLLPVLGALSLPEKTTGGTKEHFKAYITKAEQIPAPQDLAPWIERAVITVVTIIGLGVFTYGIDTEYGELFIGYLFVVVFSIWALHTAGLLDRFSRLVAHHRSFTLAMGFAAAIAFPFTQTDDHYANIGVNILIFGTVALGLNIVVGLAGLLDLGYVAFLGVGAYTAALVSGSEFSTFSGVHFPFWAAALTGAAASLVFGILIGAPTLRLRGDYLAIVTLGFGEIFRIAVNNMDGDSGPDITNGPNGIPAIPDLKLLGFDLGQPHDIAGFTLGRFANYYLLMVLIMAIVVLVYTRAADSRIGRSWIAIREDETAATAMGINGFRVKLIAFALGAALAGLAGTVSAHVTYSVVPTPYQFAGSTPPNSAFLLAAVVLGGMGTVAGPILGAALLYLLPEKLVFLQDKSLLAFGIALILLMRFRPEGIIANRRRQLEFHETGQLDVPDQTTLTDTPGTVTKAGA